MSPTEPLLSDHLARALVEFAPDGLLVVDEAGVMINANQRLCDLFGYQLDDLIGRPIELLVPVEARGRHAAHRTRFGAEPTVRTMGVGRLLKGRRHDGSEIAVEVGLSPMASDDGLHVVAIVRDVSEQTALRSRANLIQQAIDAIHDGVFMFDGEDLRFTYVNDGAVAQTGYRRDELLTMTPLHIKPLFTESRFREMIAPLLAGESPSIEFETVHRRKDGVDVPVDIILGYPQVEDTELDPPLVAIVRDITERKEAEAERARFGRQTELISRLRLGLLGTLPLSRTLGSLCADVAGIGLADDAVILEHDEAAGELTAWGARGVRDVALPLGGRIASICTVGPVDADPIVHHVGDSDLPAADRATLEALGATTLVTGAIGRGRGLALVVSGMETTVGAHPEPLIRLIIGVREALALSDARSDQQRMRLLEDRERIATDLHDVVIQRLYAAGMRLQAALPLVDQGAKERLHSVVTELDTTIAEIRETIFALHEHRRPLEPLSMRVEEVVRANQGYLGFAPVLRCDPGLDGLDGTVADQVIPVMTEMLSNVARHAAASSVEVELELSGGEVRISVRDNGVGIDPAAPRGRGLDNLARRARDLGGDFEVIAHGGGTTARWCVPAGSAHERTP